MCKTGWLVCAGRVTSFLTHLFQFRSFFLAFQSCESEAEKLRMAFGYISMKQFKPGSLYPYSFLNTYYHHDFGSLTLQ